MNKPDRVNVPMCGSHRASAPTIIYTENIGTCLGLGFYKEREGSIYHVGGVEETSLDVFNSVVETEVSRLGSGIYVCFVTGLVSIDKEVQKQVRRARTKAGGILDSHKSAFARTEQHHCEVPGQGIGYFSVDCTTGRFTVRKKKYSQRLLEFVEYSWNATRNSH